MNDKEAQRIAGSLEIISVELVKVAGLFERLCIWVMETPDEREERKRNEAAQREAMARALATQQQAAGVVQLHPAPSSSPSLGFGGIVHKPTT